jgi:LacI family transcriptional regulator
MTTMQDVATRAGVSAKTVSRVFNDDPHVLPETRTRVRAAMEELRYVPNTLAVTFRSGRSSVLGVAVPDLADPFFTAVAKAAEDVAARHAMSVLVTSLGEDPAREQEGVESLLRRQLSGLLVAPTSGDQAYLAAWASRTPVVFVDRPPRGLLADSFTEDDRAGARLATMHLIDHGHRLIAFVGNDERVITTTNRLAGYRDALAAAGLDYRDDLVLFGAKTPEGARRAVAALDARNPQPTAVFSTDTGCTTSLIPELAGRRWAVVAFGDVPMGAMLSPALTVIDQDPIALGTLAAERAITRLARPQGRYRRRTVLPVTLIERRSCDPAALAGGLFPFATPGLRSITAGTTNHEAQAAE